MRLLFLFLMLSSALSVPSRSVACAAAIELADLHAGYSALVSQDATRPIGSVALNVVELVRGLSEEGAPADVSRMARIAADLTHLAESAASGRTFGDLSPRARARHIENLDEIRTWISATGCATSATQPDILEASGERGLGPSKASALDTSMLSSPRAPLVMGISAAAFLAAVSALALIVLRRRGASLFRRRIDTRHSVSFDVEFLVAGEIDPHKARVVDMSMSGFKLETASELSAKTRITLSVAELVLPATIVWSNAFFAGVKLSQDLDPDSFRALQEL